MRFKGHLAIVAALAFSLSGCSGGQENGAPNGGPESLSGPSSTAGAAAVAAASSPSTFEYPEGWDIPEIAGVEPHQWELVFGYTGEFRHGDMTARVTAAQAASWVESVGAQWTSETLGSESEGRWFTNAVNADSAQMGVSATLDEGENAFFSYSKLTRFTLEVISLPESWSVLPTPPGIPFKNAEIIVTDTLPRYVLSSYDVQADLLDRWIDSLVSDGWSANAGGTEASNSDFHVGYSVESQGRIVVTIEPLQGTSKDWPMPGVSGEGLPVQESSQKTVAGAHEAAGGPVPASALAMEQSLTPNQFDEHPFQIQSVNGDLACVISTFHKDAMTCLNRAAAAAGEQAVADIPNTGAANFAVAGSDLGWLALDAKTLKPGEIVFHEKYVCAADDDSMTCWHADSGHGLVMGPAGFKLF